MKHARITLFAGHYGSGKTNIAVNYAMALRKEEPRVTIADLDTVNPYFRTKDSDRELQAADINLIVSEFANTNLDTPALPQQLYAIIDDKNSCMVVDIGGDDRGAYALGRFADGIKEENNYEMLLVLNHYRPLTSTPEEAIEIMHEIEEACHLSFTGLVNNSNLGDETTPEDVLKTVAYTQAVSEATGLPIRFTTVKESIYPLLQDKIENLLPLQLQKKII